MNATAAEDFAMVHRLLHPKPGDPFSSLDVVTDPAAIIEIGRDLIHGRRTGFLSIHVKPGAAFNGRTHTATQIVEPVTVTGICTVPDVIGDSVLSLAWFMDGRPTAGMVKVGDIERVHVQRR